MVVELGCFGGGVGVFKQKDTLPHPENLFPGGQCVP